MTKDGYVRVQRAGHPTAPKDGYVLEHRLVMEQHLGRLLLPTEVVHHKNRVRTDNRIENLEVLPGHAAHIRLSQPTTSEEAWNLAVSLVDLDLRELCVS